MANNPFSDFSALKSLKKELEKQDDPKTPVKPTNEPRKRTVTHKTKEDILGDQKARETGLQPGMRVTLMDSSDRGVIKRVRNCRISWSISAVHCGPSSSIAAAGSFLSMASVTAFSSLQSGKNLILFTQSPAPGIRMATERRR